MAEGLYFNDLFRGARSEADRRMAFELLDYAIADRIREKCGPYLVNIDPGKQKNYRFHSRASETA